MDVNADLGEGCGDDASMLTIVTSANVAAGAHAGGGDLLLATVERAIAEGVQVGAHISYRDVENFGRISHADSAGPDMLRDLVEQIHLVRAATLQFGKDISHVKPHGALYHDAASTLPIARLVMQSIRIAADEAAREPWPILTMPSRHVAELGKEFGIRLVAEAFADRAYEADGSLVPRSQPHSVHQDADQVVAQALEIAQTHSVLASEGQRIPVVAQSICLHGDTPGAVHLALAVTTALSENGIPVEPFASASA